MYEVKIFNGDGEKIKTISAEKVRIDHWDMFDRVVIGGVMRKDAPAIKKKCIHCKKEFKTVKPRVKICSPNCKKTRTKAQAKKAFAYFRVKQERAEELAKDKKCKECGNSYKSAKKNKLFCQTLCNQRFYNRVRTEVRRERRSMEIENESLSAAFEIEGESLRTLGDK
tara:strand:+ start:3939 stop:4442 length:504 start_codon:yes stop_codon:yes gene_type:complete